MTVWDWIANYRAEAQSQGDAERVRLTEFHHRAYALREVDPSAAIATYLEGRRLALLLHEPLWVLFFDHWHVTMLLWFKQDYTNLLERAVRNVLEARKPLYDPLQLRITIQRTLICVYQAIDLFGYADEVRAGLAELEKLISHEGEEKYLIQSNRIGFHFTAEEYQEARATCLVTLRWADQDGPHYDATHHAIYAYALLCGICWHERDWEGLANWVDVGAETTQRSGHKMEAIEFLLWRAVVERQAGREERARLLRRQGLRRLRHLGAPTSDLCFEALCAFHELAGEWHSVVKMRRRELRRCVKMGSCDEIVRCRLRICRALVRLGQPVRRAVDRARRQALVLRKPEVYLRQLDALAGEEGT